MTKTLAQKFDFLMDLTNTKNADFARALRYDPSYVSRIRSGKRGLPKGQPFLEDLMKAGGSFDLLLFSDEDMVWLYEDEAFALRWNTLMLQLIHAGSRIRIVHTLGRNVQDMWEAVRSWLPLYSTGAVEPWYCPRLRDGIFKRTMFLASGHSALVASSVPGQ